MGEQFMANVYSFIGMELVTALVCIGGVWAFFRSLRKIGSTSFTPGKATAFWIIAVTSILNVTFPAAAGWVGLFCLILFFVSIPVSLLAGPLKRSRNKCKTKNV